ncbi:SslE/AcfD family lipoprotein zinc metalloprotease [Vibrio rarus]|uniref:SslE/AcfD family lipoprotein zinc metalloprotease n=1 Tax=Vibrio rarus TaxID=413403 RepID=UPI0021C32E23|nr:SslE/AcfD family lipoprotein zinc metalloprotease [Vibrio rarus]
MKEKQQTERIPASKLTPSTERIAASKLTPSTERIAASKLTPSTERIAASKLTPSTEHITASKLTPSTEHITASKLTPSTEHITASKLTPSTEHIAASKLTPSTEHIPASKLTPSTERIPASKLTPSTEHIPASKLTPSTERIPASKLTPSTVVSPRGSLLPQLKLTPATEVTPQEKLKPSTEVIRPVKMYPSISSTPMLLTPSTEHIAASKLTPSTEVIRPVKMYPSISSTPMLLTPSTEHIAATKLTPSTERIPASKLTPSTVVSPRGSLLPQLKLTPATEVTPQEKLTPSTEVIRPVKMYPSISSTPMLLTPSTEHIPAHKLTPAKERSIAATKLTPSTEHIAATKLTPSTEHIAATKLTPSTEHIAATKLTPSTEHIAASKLTPSTEHIAATKLTPSTEHIKASKLTPSTEKIPQIAVIPQTVYTGNLLASGKQIKGDVECNGEKLTNGTFAVGQGRDFECNLGDVILGEFTAPFPPMPKQPIIGGTSSDSTAAASPPPAEPIHPNTSFDLKDRHGDNAAKLLQSISHCQSSDEICLQELDHFDIEEVYKNISDDAAVNEFIEEKSTNKVDIAPSSHVDNSIVPAISRGTKNDLNAGFVSANAEASYEYKPKPADQVLMKGKLTDENGVPIAGMSFFSASSRGTTDENGEFEYKSGDTISFGIDTFEFGEVKGNQIDYKLSDVTENPIIKQNIQSLIERYVPEQNGTLTITDKIHTVFEQYPNVINELINLSLPNGEKLEGSTLSLPNDFESQFHDGLTADIDEALKKPSNPSEDVYDDSENEPKTAKIATEGKYVTKTLNDLFTNVGSFHVFHDNQSFFGATGYPRGTRALNVSNKAFPIMMPRIDKNRNIPFGQPQIWTREGHPYFVEYTNLKGMKYDMPAIPLVSKDNATYGFPFVAAGGIGKGKVVFMGNSLYPSILSCPHSYWADRSIKIENNGKENKCGIAPNFKDDKALYDDHGDMKTFFSNLFQWFNNGQATKGMKVATNIETGYIAQHNIEMGKPYSFFINKEYGFGDVEKLTKGSFNLLSVEDTPILILQAYSPEAYYDGMNHRFVADVDNPNLTKEDVTALIRYINDGGNVLFMDAIDDRDPINPEPIGRLADAAGVSLGGENVTDKLTNQAFCGNSYYCNWRPLKPNLHVKSEKDMVVLERFSDNDGKQPYTVNPDGSVTWEKGSENHFEIPTYKVLSLDKEGKAKLDDDGKPVLVDKYARIFVTTAEEREAAIKELQDAFKGTPICTNKYEYEFNCIETRKGDGIKVRGNYARADFDRYPMSKDVVTSMVKAANLGTNITALYNHEIYYRTRGKQGIRLSNSELTQAYDNLSVWMWNDNKYNYVKGQQDELGFKNVVQFLNCYTGGKYQPAAIEAKCPVDLKASLVAHNMMYGSDKGKLSGELNPSYPLNFMEKPLTRIMLGRSYWDHDIKVDTTKYPGQTPGIGHTDEATIETDGNGKAVTYSAGNMQSTGLWAPQLQTVTVSGGVEATITVMLADDLTGKDTHELSLKRPPRMRTSYHYDGSSLSFEAPYGGLIYIKPNVKDEGEQTFTFNNVETAAYWKDGDWIHKPQDAVAPIAEIDTGTFIYTAPIKNVRTIDVQKFADGINRFANAASDFYGRDQKEEVGKHRRYTYENEHFKGFRHRFVNDVEISIGSAHSGYPVMDSAFDANKNDVPTDAVNDWLIWHEVGHNLASAPFVAAGSAEVSNNFLALYMQELEGRNEHPRMDRIIFEIQKAPLWLGANSGHAWSNGDAGMRLVMFGQLKVWAKTHFSIDNWYAAGDQKPSVYGKDAGWNMVKLMHRKARGDVQGDNLQGRDGTNYCSSKETGLSGGDLMMVCSSYVSGYNLSDFFQAWNIGEESMTNADGTKTYNGGISSKAVNVVSKLNLQKPKNSPLKVDSLTYSEKG